MTAVSDQARLPALLALLAAAAVLPGCVLHHQTGMADYSGEAYPVVTLRGDDIRFDV